MRVERRNTHTPPYSQLCSGLVVVRSLRTSFITHHHRQNGVAGENPQRLTAVVYLSGLQSVNQSVSPSVSP